MEQQASRQRLRRTTPGSCVRVTLQGTILFHGFEKSLITSFCMYGNKICKCNQFIHLELFSSSFVTVFQFSTRQEKQLNMCEKKQFNKKTLNHYRHNNVALHLNFFSTLAAVVCDITTVSIKRLQMFTTPWFLSEKLNICCLLHGF